MRKQNRNSFSYDTRQTIPRHQDTDRAFSKISKKQSKDTTPLTHKINHKNIHGFSRLSHGKYNPEPKLQQQKTKEKKNIIVRKLYDSHLSLNNNLQIAIFERDQAVQILNDLQSKNQILNENLEKALKLFHKISHNFSLHSSPKSNKRNFNKLQTIISNSSLQQQIENQGFQILQSPIEHQLNVEYSQSSLADIKVQQEQQKDDRYNKQLIFKTPSRRIKDLKKQNQELKNKLLLHERFHDSEISNLLLDFRPDSNDNWQL